MKWVFELLALRERLLRNACFAVQCASVVGRVHVPQEAPL
jgi:hypothetical protein